VRVVREGDSSLLRMLVLYTSRNFAKDVQSLPSLNRMCLHTSRFDYIANTTPKDRPSQRHQITLDAMSTRVLKALLIAEGLQTPSCLARRLEGQGCWCSFARSYREACSSLGNQDFDLVLSPLRLRGVSLFPLVDLLEGSKVTLFYSHPVEQGCWWLPALRRGQKCLGSAAFRPREFVSVLDEVIVEVRADWHVIRDLQKPAQQSARAVLMIQSSRNEPALTPSHPRRSEFVSHTPPKRLAR
jgi:hypothetical protein